MSGNIDDDREAHHGAGVRNAVLRGAPVRTISTDGSLPSLPATTIWIDCLGNFMQTWQSGTPGPFKIPVSSLPSWQQSISRPPAA